MSALHAQPSIGSFSVVWAEYVVLTFFSKTCRGQRNSQLNSGPLHTTMNGCLQCIAVPTKNLQPPRRRSTSLRPSSRMSEPLLFLLLIQSTVQPNEYSNPVNSHTNKPQQSFNAPVQRSRVSAQHTNRNSKRKTKNSNV